jgi:hypothetical protein
MYLHPFFPFLQGLFSSTTLLCLGIPSPVQPAVRAYSTIPQPATSRYLPSNSWHLYTYYFHLYNSIPRDIHWIIQTRIYESVVVDCSNLLTPIDIHEYLWAHLKGQFQIRRRNLHPRFTVSLLLLGCTEVATLLVVLLANQRIPKYI